MGTWAHEIGHSLRGRSGSDGKARYVRDRYNYADPSGQHGDIDHWGLMGKGCHWGEPLGSAPTHMCGLTKYSAGWLGLEDAKLGKSSDLVALERMSAGDDLLRVDDPTTRDPRSFYLVEARDAAEPYGAPEAGVVVYKVSWAKDHRHYVVNALEAPVGATRAEGANGYWALRPTLRGAAQSGSPSRLSIPAAKLAIALSSVSSEGGYAAVVIADTYTPTHLMGAVLAPRGKSAVPAPEGQGPKGDVFVAGSGPPLPLPDIDLHAYDEQGRHVGLNYETHQYERLIPGAQASGDLKDDAEWIYAPEGTAVSYQVRTDKTAQFLANNPQYADTVRPQSYEVTYHKIDAEGAITQARGEKSKLEAGESDDLKGPDGKRLRYRTMRVPGYGRNWPEDWGQAISIMLIILLGVSGWVVTVLRWWQAKAA